MKKVVIVTNGSGGGHWALTQAVTDLLKNEIESEKIQLRVIDPLPNNFPIMYSFLCSARWSFLWGFFWHLTNRKSIALLFQKVNYFFIKNKLDIILSEFKPDIVLTNSPLSTYELGLYKKKKRVDFNIIIHVADPYTPHVSWFTYSNADLFLCPTDEVVDLACSYGIPKEKLCKCGWITKDLFMKPAIGISNLRSNLGISKNDFLIFIGGGGLGGVDSINLIKELMPYFSTHKIKIILNTGFNKISLNQVVNLVHSNKKNIILFPYINNIRAFLGISDLVIGKAGPNFMFEVLHSNKPFIANGALPGQEEGNLDFLKKSDIGWVETDPNNIKNLVIKMISDSKIVTNKLQKYDDYLSFHRNSGSRVYAALSKFFT